MLDKIGFYTLSEKRAKTASWKSPMMRCEMILTNACNFRCSYCRGLSGNANKPLLWHEIELGLNWWMADGLKNIRFSGGEPTLHPNLIDAVKLCKTGRVERIAVSSNGSLPISIYSNLLDAGVNDFSISLDACCSIDGDIISGISGKWNQVIENIKYLSRWSYTTVGIVVINENTQIVNDTIKLAHDLGVADIRVIPAAQLARANSRQLEEISEEILNNHPILKYRVTRAILGHSVRGISRMDVNRCGLVLDDSVIAGNEHYPCVIYLREKGAAIGKVGEFMRAERKQWFETHNTFDDAICRNNCLDVCIEYNNAFGHYHSG